MFTHLARYLTLKDKKRIAAVNDHLLYPSTPNLFRGTLYLDGEGTASGYVARRAAELYLAGEFNKVVMTGSRIPAKDWRLKIIASRLEKDGISLPEKGESEAQYMQRIFLSLIGKDRAQDLQDNNALHLIEGKNTGEKIRNSSAAFNNAAAIQAVTLVYGQRRVHGTFRKELGDEIPVSVDGVYPMGITKENWDKEALAYITVMGEADKSGPRLDGKPLVYREYFHDIDIKHETAKITAFNIL